MSTYTFSASSHHSESNDMRQPHVLTNMLRNSGTWVSDDVTTSKMAKISKSQQNLEGYPRSFFLIGSWLTKTGVKKWFQFNGHRTPDFDPTISHWCPCASVWTFIIKPVSLGLQYYPEDNVPSSWCWTSMSKFGNFVSFSLSVIGKYERLMVGLWCVREELGHYVQHSRPTWRCPMYRIHFRVCLSVHELQGTHFDLWT